MKQALNVLFCVNDEYAQHAGASIYSVVKNNPNVFISITVAALGLQLGTKTKFEQLAQQLDVTITIKEFDAQKLDLFPQIGLYSKDIYIRLWVDEFYDSIPDRVLYLDADTICVGSLDSLVNEDLGENLFGAVAIPGATSQTRCIMPIDEAYINSGVILFNMKSWDGPIVRNKIAEYLSENRKTALNPDQDALNSLFYMERQLLGPQFNCISPIFRNHGLDNVFNKNELHNIYDNLAIVHFNGVSRPWHYTCCHPYASHYIEYRKKTPWCELAFDDKSLINVLKKQVRLLFNLDRYSKIKKLKPL